MNRRTTQRWFLGLFGATLAGAIASSSSCDDTMNNGLTPGGGGGGASATSSSSSGDGGGLVIPDACVPRCTNDLKKIIDCYGNVLKECLPEQGCSSMTTECIDDPCLAAVQSKSSYGCDYWALKTGLGTEALGACFAAFVANTWSTPVKINVEYDKMKLPVSSFAYIPEGQGASLTYTPYNDAMGLPPNKVAVLFLARNKAGFVPACPMDAAAITTEVGVLGTGHGKAFHISTDRPVVSYQILPYGGGSSAFTSATLLLPTSVWGTNYIAVNAYPEGKVQIPNGSPLIDILAKEDNTTVTLLPNVDVVGGVGVPASVKNTKAMYTLNAGEFLQINQPAELTGSPIESDKPVGVWGGSTCLYVPPEKAACDSAQQQIPPVQALGSEYAAIRYRGRNGQDEVVPWRIVGARDGTMLTWDPAPPANAPPTINSGGVYEFDSTGPFVVRSQGADFPFYLAAYMTAGSDFNDEGDPEWVNVVPTAQYLDHYVMFADPTYSETNLVVVRTKAPEGGKFADVTLDCAGPLTGWQDLGNYQWTRVDLVTGNFSDVGGCSNGGHELSSSLPFGVTVWGWGSKAALNPITTLVSYAYPAGAGVQLITDFHVPTDPK